MIIIPEGTIIFEINKEKQADIHCYFVLSNNRLLSLRNQLITKINHDVKDNTSYYYEFLYPGVST